MQSDRPLAAYRCGLYANSFLRANQERNHTRLWEVDLVDELPASWTIAPCLNVDARRPDSNSEKAGGGRAASSRFWRCPLDCFSTIIFSRPKGRKICGLGSMVSS